MIASLTSDALENVMTLSLEIIESKEGIKRFLSQWTVFERSQAPLFYQRGIYFLAYCEHLMPATVSPHLLVFSEGERIVGIFPWIKQKHTQFGIPYYHVGTIQHDHINLSDVLFDDAYLNEIATLLQTYIRTLPWNASVSLRDVREDSQFIKLLPLLSLKTFQKEMGKSAYIDFDKNTDEHLPKRMVKNVKRLMRKANDHGSVEFQFLTDDEITPKAFDDFLEVESSGWKGQSGTVTAIKLNADLKAYYQMLLDDQASQMQLSLYYLNGDPIAAHYCFKDDASISLAKVGYIEEHKALSPSHVLIYQAIHNASERYCQTEQDDHKYRISFVTGAGWLNQWYPESATLYAIHISPSILSTAVLSVFEGLKKLRNARREKAAAAEKASNDSSSKEKND